MSTAILWQHDFAINSAFGIPSPRIGPGLITGTGFDPLGVRNRAIYPPTETGIQGAAVEHSYGIRFKGSFQVVGSSGHFGFGWGGQITEDTFTGLGFVASDTALWLVGATNAAGLEDLVIMAESEVGVVDGDLFVIESLPTGETTVSINGEVRLTATGTPFRGQRYFGFAMWGNGESELGLYDDGLFTVEAAMVRRIGTVQKAIDRVRTFIAETDPDDSYVSDTEILDFLNLAQIDLATRYNVTPYYEEIAGSSFDPDTKEYMIPVTSDLLVIERLHVNQVPFTSMAYEPYDSARYAPRGYWFRDNKLGIPAVQPGDTVKMWGRQTPLDLVVTGDIQLHSAFAMPLVSYAVMLCKVKDQDEQGVSFWEQRYERELHKARAAAAQTQVGVRSIIKVV
jgi:hypothetical protein